MRPARLGSWVAGLALAAGLMCGACSAPAQRGPTTSTTAPTVSAVLPPGGAWLKDVGFPGNPSFFTKAPAGFSIPAGVQPVGGANLAERINVIFDGGDGPVVYAYLVDNLAAMGCRITAQSSDSIVWQDAHWQGAFTMTASQAGLTLLAIG